MVVASSEYSVLSRRHISTLQSDFVYSNEPAIPFVPGVDDKCSVYLITCSRMIV